MEQKVEAGQASRVVLNLTNNGVDLAALKNQFAQWKIDGLEQIIVVIGNKVIQFWP